MINLGLILRSKSVLESLPSDGNTFESHTVVYNVLPPISSKIFNFKKFVSEKVNDFLQDETILPCNCENSPFSDAHHGHIITGNLDIVADPNLKKLFLKGPKFREPKPFDWVMARASIENGVFECARNWREKK